MSELNKIKNPKGKEAAKLPRKPAHKCRRMIQIDPSGDGPIFQGKNSAVPADPILSSGSRHRNPYILPTDGQKTKMSCRLFPSRTTMRRERSLPCLTDCQRNPAEILYTTPLFYLNDSSIIFLAFIPGNSITKLALIFFRIYIIHWNTIVYELYEFRRLHIHYNDSITRFNDSTCCLNVLIFLYFDRKIFLYKFA